MPRLRLPLIPFLVFFLPFFCCWLMFLIIAIAWSAAALNFFGEIWCTLSVKVSSFIPSFAAFELVGAWPATSAFELNSPSSFSVLPSDHSFSARSVKLLLSLSRSSTRLYTRLFSRPSVYAEKRAARVRALSLSLCASWPWPNVLTPGNRMGGSWVGFGETFCLWAVLTAFFPDSDMKKPEFHQVHSVPQPFKLHSHHTWLLWSKLKQGQCYQSALLQVELLCSTPPSQS